MKKKENLFNPVQVMLIIGSMLVIFIIYVYFELTSGDKYIKKINTEFKELIKEDFVAGRIVFIEPDHPNVKSVGALIILNTNRKLWLNNVYNDYCGAKYLVDIIAVNDSILKPANSDSLYLFKGNKKYCFDMNKCIYKKRDF